MLISRRGTLDPVPQVDGVFILEEHGNYDIRSTSGLEPKELFWGDRKLSLRERSCWELDTGYEVGNLEIRSGAEGTNLLRARVVPAGEKIAEDDWVRLLEEVEQWLPSGTTGPMGATHGKVGSTGTYSPLLGSALVPLIGPLQRALHNVVESPREHLVRAEKEVPAHLVRAVRQDALRWLARRPAALGALGFADSSAGTSKPLFTLGCSAATRDHPGHRYLVWLIERASQSVSALIQRLIACAVASEGNASGEAAWLQSRANRLREAEKALVWARKGSWLSGVTSMPPSEGALLCIRDDPQYARLHKLLRRFVSPLFSLNGDDGTEAPVRATYDVYELWCFLALSEALRRRFPLATWRTHGISPERFALGKGSGARCSVDSPEGRLVLYFNLTFAGFLRRRSRTRFSISKERRPDLVLTWTSPGGEKSWVCVDAKYRVSPDAVGEALGSAHIYRDSLRWEELGGRCKSVHLLVPRMTAQCTPWFSQEFLLSNGIAVREAFRGSDMDALAAELINELCGSSGP
jgi:hypothetical protein